MKAQVISALTLAMVATAGLATAQEPNVLDPNLPAATLPEPVSDANLPEANLPKANLPASEPRVFGDFIPITRSERLKHYLAGTFGRKALAGSAMRAEIGQMTNSPKEWGSGGRGFATRFASGFGQHFTRRTLEYGASSVLHEDNRYRPSGQRRFWKRTGYAIVSTFVTRHDNGRRGFAFSRLGSAGGASFLSRLWMPHAVATMGAGASSFGITIGIDIGTNMLREFWPDLKRHFRRH